MKMIQCGHITWIFVVCGQALQALLLDILTVSLQQGWLVLFIFFYIQIYLFLTKSPFALPNSCLGGDHWLSQSLSQHYLHQVVGQFLIFKPLMNQGISKTQPKHRDPVATVWLGFTWHLGAQHNQRSKDTHKSHIFSPADLLLDKHQYFPSAPTTPEKRTPGVAFSLLNMVCLSQLIPGPFAVPDSCLGGGHWLSQSMQPSIGQEKGSGEKFLRVQGD